MSKIPPLRWLGRLGRRRALDALFVIGIARLADFPGANIATDIASLIRSVISDVVPEFFFDMPRRVKVSSLVSERATS